MLNGMIILDKPTGLSSNRALQKVKRLLKAEKAGHTGTLDPLASGMLPIGLGRATRLSSFFLEADKSYTTTVQLGELRSTGDAEGELVTEMPVPALDESSIEAVLSQFRGPVNQVPPMFSALKHQGKPLYELARQGINVERKARTVTIYACELLGFTENSIDLRVKCSKGTYIRTLGEDIAQALGTVGFLSALRRDYCAGFNPEQMVTLEQLESSNDPHAFIIPIEHCVDWPQVSLSNDELEALLQGHKIQLQSDVSGRVLLMHDDQAAAFADINGGIVIERTFLL